MHSRSASWRAASSLALGLGLTASALASSCAAGRHGSAPLAPRVDAAATPARDRRRLGSLEVSSVGLGVQNMSRTYQTTIPHRPEMLNIIRTAFDRGVTFFDAAEAYGPHEVERILGEGIAPFRDQVVITSKFGWNIDLETGERRPGLNSRPDHIKLASRACSSACAPIASICSTSTASIPRCRSRMSPARSRT